MINTLLLIIGFCVCLFTIQYAILIIASFFHRNSETTKKFSPKVKLIFPAYKPSNIFLKVLKNVAQTLPDKYSVFVLLQNASQEIKEKVKVDFPQFEIISKDFDHLQGNSYQHALKFISQKLKNESTEEYIMLLDKDNLVDHSFFKKLHQFGNTDTDIIQGKRGALKMDNSISFFDSFSETLNDAMFRSAKNVLGLPLEISGSAALIKKGLFIQTIDQLDPKAPGFDKNFMVNLLINQKKLKTLFIPQAIVFEEKTANTGDFQNQRIRWFGEQYYNAYKNGPILIKELFRGNYQALDYLLTLIRPPRSILFGLVFILSLIELGLNSSGHSTIPFNSICLLILIVSNFILLLRNRMLMPALRASIQIPKLIVSNIFSVSNSLKKRNLGKFIHTNHQL